MTMPLFWQAVAASLLGGFASMAVAACLTFGLPRSWLVRMVSFSAGLMLAVALLDLLPEAAAAGLSMQRIGGAVLAGLIGFYLLERGALWRHDHRHGLERHAGYEAEASVSPLLVIAGDSLHNFTDGVLLAAAFLVDDRLGWSTALAVAAHEIPQEAGDFVLLLEAGLSRARAFFWNGLSSLASLVGMLLGWFWLEQARDWLPIVICLAAASFIYISACDLLPWLKRQKDGVGWQAGLLCSGVAVVALCVNGLHG